MKLTSITLSCPTRASRSDDGVTLAELLVVMTLLVLVVSSSYLLMNTVSGWIDTVDARSRATDQARVMIDRITRELRQAVEITEGGGAFSDAQPRRCAFYSDVDHDGAPELVTYRVQSKYLYRSVAEPSKTVPPYAPYGAAVETLVMSSVDSSWNGNVFTYYDRSDPPAEVSPGHEEDVSAVSLRLVNYATVGKKTEFVDLSTWVKVRSIKNSIE